MLKIGLVGNQFVSVEETQQKVTLHFCHTTRDWVRCFQQWQDC